MLDLKDLNRVSRAVLRDLWRKEFGEEPLKCFGRDLLALGIAYKRQECQFGRLPKSVTRELDRLFARMLDGASDANAAAAIGRPPMRPGTVGRPPMRPGTVLVREWRGTAHQVTIVAEGFAWNGRNYRSLSGIARAITGTKWNGP